MCFSAEMWKIHRKYLNNCFNTKLLQSFFTAFNQSARILTSKIAVFSKNTEEFDIFHSIAKCTLEMICGKTEKHILHFKTNYILLVTAFESDEELQGSEGGIFMDAMTE